MLVCLAYHQGDKPQAVSLAQWIRELGQVSDHTCLLCCGDGCDESGVIEPLREVFGKVSAFKPQAKVKRGDGKMGYARAANAMWQSVAWKIYFQDKVPWLWLEPDAIPTRPSWLTEIWEDHRASKKAFSGAMGQAQVAMLNGVAVYPPNVCDFAPLALQAGDCPWDLNAAPQILKYANVTNLFQHIYQINGEAPTFPKHADKLNGAALFHRCKDGSLIEYLKTAGYTSGQSGVAHNHTPQGFVGSNPTPATPKVEKLDDAELMGESVDYAQRLEDEARRKSVKPVQPNEGDRLGELVWRDGKWHTASDVGEKSKSDRSAVMAKYKHPEKDFSRPGFSAQADGDKRTMAATPGEGTAPKPVQVNAEANVRQSNSGNVKLGVTAGETAIPSRDDLVKEAVAVLKQLCSSPRATSQVRKELKKQKVVTK